MKYRTVIELVVEADNEHEATDIAGEYLRGDLESGVRMKFSTKPLTAHTILKIYIPAALAIAVPN